MSQYTFRHGCDSCDQKPILKNTGMCAVCTFGESDALWEWIFERWEGKELAAAQRYLKDMQRELAGAGMSFGPDIAPRILQLLSFKPKGGHHAKKN